MRRHVFIFDIFFNKNLKAQQSRAVFVPTCGRTPDQSRESKGEKDRIKNSGPLLSYVCVYAETSFQAGYVDIRFDCTSSQILIWLILVKYCLHVESP